MQVAQEEGMDLVEVNPNQRPPVCRIMDYGKFRYEQKKAQKGGSARVDIKEIRVRPKTGTHDIDVKIKRGRKFLIKGHKVQLTMLLRGREKAYPDRARQILLDVATQFEDIAKVEQEPRLNHNRMQMMFGPDKNAISRLQKEEAKAAKEAARAAEADDADDEDVDSEDELDAESSAEHDAVDDGAEAEEESETVEA